MRLPLAWVAGAALLAGCGGPSKAKVPYHRVEPRTDPEAYTQEEVNRLARGGETDPAWREIREAYASGKMSDQDFAVLQGRLHAAGMSGQRAQEMTQDMETARQASRKMQDPGK